MAQADRIFKKAFRKNFVNHEGNYPLTRQINLGDWGVIQSGSFQRKGNIINSFDVSFSIRLDSSPSHEEFKLSSSVTVNPVVQGQVGSDGQVAVKAKIELKFSSKKEVFFSSSEVRYNEIEDLDKVEQKLATLYNSGKWKADYYLVTKIMEGTNSVIIISGSNNSTVDIEASSPAVQALDLADASVKFGLSKESNLAYDIVVPDKCQLGFALGRIERGAGGGDTDGPVAFTPVTADVEAVKATA